MSRNRKNATLNKKMKQQEERLDRKNSWGVNDPTPYAAVAEVIRREGSR